MTTNENLLEGMENIFHKGPTDISGQVTDLMLAVMTAALHIGRNPRPDGRKQNGGKP